MLYLRSFPAPATQSTGMFPAAPPKMDLLIGSHAETTIFKQTVHRTVSLLEQQQHEDYQIWLQLTSCLLVLVQETYPLEKQFVEGAKSTATFDLARHTVCLKIRPFDQARRFHGLSTGFAAFKRRREWQAVSSSLSAAASNHLI